MWIILLDHSGSMGQPFEGKQEFAGRSTTSEARIKLEAAKAALLEHLLGLGTPVPVVLFEFTDSASMVFEGMSTDTAGIQKALDRIEAGGSTDLAMALQAAEAHARAHVKARLFRVLAISDGLSEEEPAAAAATSLAEAGAVIDVILIDPTNKGNAVARRIAIDGFVRAVVSAEELHAGIGNAAAASAALAQEAEEFRARHEREAQKVALAAPAEERLAFTAGYPGSALPEQWYSLLIYLHLADLEAEARALLDKRAAALQMKPSTFSQAATSKLRRGTILRLEPRAEGIEFNPPVHEVIWYEDIQEVSFRLRIKADAAGKFLSGGVGIHAEGVVIALLPLVIRALMPGEAPSETQQSIRSARTFERVFASYSTQDSAIVNACVAAYQALGIYVYIDKEVLRSSSGQGFWPILKECIRRSDVLQLYWSQAARESKYVEDEWRYAYSLLSTKGDHFIHPVTWEREMPKPPPELAHRHFARLDLETLFPGGIPPAQLAGASARPGTRPIAPIPTVVLPLLPSTEPGEPAEMRRALAEVVHFLEETTGQRYYPAPTLLVDDYVVRTVRSRLTTDRFPPDAQTIELALSLAELLNCIALELHVRFRDKLLPKANDFSFDEAFGSGRLMSAVAMRAVLHQCEFIVFSMVEEWLRAYDMGLGDRLTQSITPRRADETLSEYLLRAFDQILARTSAVKGSRSLRATVWESRIGNPQPLLQKAGLTVRYPTRTSLEILGTAQGFARALGMLRSDLPSAVVEYDHCTPDEAGGSSGPSEDARVRAELAATLADALCEALGLSSPHAPFRFALEALAKPQWRSSYESLMGSRVPGFSNGMTRLEFFEHFLSTVAGLLREGLQSLGDFEFVFDFGLSKASWSTLERAHPELKLQVHASHESRLRPGPGLALRGRFSTVVQAFERCSEHLSELLCGVSAASGLQLISTEVPTYGVFVPANAPAEDDELRRWAAERGLPTELTLPRSPRVIFCANSRDRLEKRIRAVLPEEVNAPELVSVLTRCVLVHEHFHALVETALDEGGHVPRGPTFVEAWRTASGLNEALAAWMELHFVRGQPELEKLVLAYIRAGRFPGWPYAGAEKIEDAYQRGKLDEIRRLITLLRGDPETARSVFEALGSAEEHSRP